LQLRSKERTMLFDSLDIGEWANGRYALSSIRESRSA
jgi:hypothetical protein